MPEPNLERAREEAKEKLKKTKEYLDLELRIIEDMLDYEKGTHFLGQLKDRVKDFVLGVEKEPADFSFYDQQNLKNQKEEALTERTLYFSKLNDELIRRSKLPKYHPTNGSFWEYIGDTLKDLAKEIKDDIRYQIK